MKKPFVSIIIPVKQISKYLENENLPAINKQTYRNFEVIVVVDEKSDKDKQLLLRYQWLKIIADQSITRPAKKRDLGVAHAKGEILAFIDDDAYPSNEWLEVAVKVFEQKQVEAVCGPGLLPHKTNIWEQVFDETLKTNFGSGGYQYRFVKGEARYVDDYPSMNFLIKRDVFIKLGGFDNEYWPGEDSKLCEALVYDYGGKIFYTPDVYVYHHRRGNPISFLKQYSGYGYHRGCFVAQGDKNSRRATYFIPTFFLIYLLVLIRFKKPILYLPLIVYVLLQVRLLIQALLNTKNLFTATAAAGMIWLMHITYGTMFVVGFIKGITERFWTGKKR